MGVNERRGREAKGEVTLKGDVGVGWAAVLLPNADAVDWFKKEYDPGAGEPSSLAPYEALCELPSEGCDGVACAKARNTATFGFVDDLKAADAESGVWGTF